VLSVAEWQITKVLPVTIQAIKRQETRLATTKQQVLELRTSVFVEANNFTIEHCRFGLAFERKRKIQEREGLELVHVPRHKPALARFDIS
jgi:hypothetical protein